MNVNTSSLMEVYDMVRTNRSSQDTDGWIYRKGDTG